MSPSTIRALEELLRRVLRSPGHGIDPVPQVAAARARAATYRYRHRDEGPDSSADRSDGRVGTTRADAVRDWSAS